MGGIVEVGAGLGYWKWVLEHGGEFSGSRSSSGCRGGGRGIGGAGSGGGSRDRCLDSAGIDNRMPSVVDGGGGGGGPSGLGSKGTAPLSFLAIDKDPSRLPASGGSRNPGPVIESGRNQGGPAREKKRGGRKGGRRGGGQQRGAGRPEGPAGPTHNEYHGGAPAWAAVEKGGPERLRALSAAAYPVLLLCYPPPSVGGGSGGATAGPNGCMGADVLDHFSGRVLLYVGEVGGDTGSPRLEAALRAGWDLVEEVDLPCFPSTANRLMVFNRKEAAATLSSSGRPPLPLPPGGAPTAAPGAAKQKHGTDAATPRSGTPAGTTRPPGAGVPALQESSGFGSGGGDGGRRGGAMAMYRCSGCGAAAAPSAATGDGARGVRLHRCRLTRAVSYCSEKCLAIDGERWRANLEARHIWLSVGSAVRVALQGGEYGAVFRDRKLFKRLPPPG
ncbi:unnamed protein product [Hapterophycus canaliculatus]